MGGTLLKLTVAFFVLRQTRWVIWKLRLEATRACVEMPPLRSGRYWFTGLARVRHAMLYAGLRGASSFLGCSRDPPSVAGELRGELDRFGGVSVKLDALDRLDTVAFQRALQGKCAWIKAPRAPDLSNQVTGVPTPESLWREGERACVTRTRFLPFVLVPLAGRFPRLLGEMVTSSNFRSAALLSGPLSSV